MFIGQKHGMYDKWSDARAQVYRFSGACYKRHDSRKEAHEAFDQILVDEPQVSMETSSSSTSATTSAGKVLQSRKLASCLKS